VNVQTQSISFHEERSFAHIRTWGSNHCK